ncbi:translational machinery component [Parathielavia hyrcaniae]|uniref:Small ribosomal subunit protein uS11m n=1 Tax=Parathielavia hyrcaniae TaxID=113614 RepID=A0AAN6T580_9PEZI|nr:translational machinery component [Parathielavia hyrcaniae]
MNRFTISRLLAPELARPLSRTVCPTTTTPQWTRVLSQSHAARNTWTTPQPPSPPQRPSSGSVSMDRLAKSVLRGAALPTESISASLPETLEVEEEGQSDEPYHFHIYSHKHNTHITLSKPNRDAILSLSCGNLGFRKSGRKHYDSAYQLGAYVINKMHQKGLVKKIHKLEVVLRGFGAGREAVVKVLMSNEGQMLRSKITRLSDSTRLKFGGTRSKKRRRL